MPFRVDGRHSIRTPPSNSFIVLINKPANNCPVVDSADLQNVHEKEAFFDAIQLRVSATTHKRMIAEEKSELYCLKCHGQKCLLR